MPEWFQLGGGGGERVNCNPNLGENRNSGLWLDHILNFAANRTILRFTFKMNYSFLQSLITAYPPPPKLELQFAQNSGLWFTPKPKLRFAPKFGLHCIPSPIPELRFPQLASCTPNLGVSSLRLVGNKEIKLKERENIGIWWKSYLYFLRFTH